MAKRRIYEIARELGLTSKEVLAKLNDAGIEAKAASSSVEEDVAFGVLGKGSSTPPPAKDDENSTEAKPKKRKPGLVIRKKQKASDEASASNEASEATSSEETSTEDSVVQEATPTEEEPLAKEQPAEKAEMTAESSQKPVASQKEPESTKDQDEAVTAQEEPQKPEEQKKPESTKPEKEPLAKVVYMIDKEKLMERIPSKRSPAPRSHDQDRRPPRQQQHQQPDITPNLAQPPLHEMTEVSFRESGSERRKAPTTDHDQDGERKVPKTRRQKELTKRELLEMRERTVSSGRLRKKKIRKGTGKTQITQPKESKRVVKMDEEITVADLAHQLGLKASQIIKQCMGLDLMVTQNDKLDYDTAVIIAQEHQYKVENTTTTEESFLPTQDDQPEQLKARPPVVTVMGHVDHGKTSILDAIRKSDIAAKEHGGITQHIGAYSVETKAGVITFIDTPGHAAFTSMRARGAQVTDLVILVVAADDGVMPQTIEAINHAQAAEVPIIVAMNKIDTAGSNPERVMQSLTEYNLISEDWGGDTLFVKTSAVTGEGIDDLLESIILQSEMMELKANPDKLAVGSVIEAQLDKGRGPVATVLIQEGTLKSGDIIVAGTAIGKSRALIDARGKQLKTVGPATPVEILGLSAVPSPGDPVNAVESLENAKNLVSLREDKQRQEQQGNSPKSLEDLFSQMESAERVNLQLVVKADVQGTMEAVKDALTKLSNDEVEVQVNHGGVGAITENDVHLATASKGIIVGFNVRPDNKARILAEKEGIEIKTYRVIYEAIEEIEAAMKGLQAPIISEKTLGQALVQETFKIPKAGTIAGCNVQNGKIMRSANVRLLRENVVIYEGKISSLKRFKDDVREVAQGYECGIGIENYNDIKTDDIIEAFVLEESAPA